MEEVSICLQKSASPHSRTSLGPNTLQYRSFTFVARAFASVDGIARKLADADYDFSRACEPFVGKIITEEYNQRAATKREELRRI